MEQQGFARCTSKTNHASRYLNHIIHKTLLVVLKRDNMFSEQQKYIEKLQHNLVVLQLYTFYGDFENYLLIQCHNTLSEK